MFLMRYNTVKLKQLTDDNDERIPCVLMCTRIVQWGIYRQRILVHVQIRILVNCENNNIHLMRSNPMKLNISHEFVVFLCMD